MAKKSINLKSNETIKLHLGKGIRARSKEGQKSDLVAPAKKDSKNWVEIAKIAESYAAKKDFKKAIQYYESILEGAALTPSIKSRIAIVFGQGGRVKKAFQLAKQAIKEEPDNQHHRMVLCKLYEQTNDFGKALENYQYVQDQISPRSMSEKNVSLGEDLRLKFRQSRLIWKRIQIIGENGRSWQKTMPPTESIKKQFKAIPKS